MTVESMISVKKKQRKGIAFILDLAIGILLCLSGKQKSMGIELWSAHLKCCMLFWVLEFKKVIKLLESFQRKATRMVKGLEVKPYEEQLSALGLFSLEATEGSPHGNLYLSHKREWRWRH